MRDDQTCGNCEWWDDRSISEDDIRDIEIRNCLRWREHNLMTCGHDRCWQWCVKGKGGSDPPWVTGSEDAKKPGKLTPQDRSLRDGSVQVIRELETAVLKATGILTRYLHGENISCEAAEWLKK